MKSVSVDEKESVETLFQNSIYQNSHLGWLDLWELYTADGSVWLDNLRRKSYLIGLQPSSSSIFWLHSFYAEAEPGNYPLEQKIKEILPAGKHSVYTISSHSWFNKLLEKNRFRNCDEIVEMETSEIQIPNRYNNNSTFSLSENVSCEIISKCEIFFPPLWRLSASEIECAYKTSSYKLVIKENDEVIGCLLADFDDNNCHIQRIVVFPEYQYRGAASAMIRQMSLDAKKNGINSFSVNTNKNNSTALHFYQHMNFSIQGKHYPVYYRYI